MNGMPIISIEEKKLEKKKQTFYTMLDKRYDFEYFMKCFSNLFFAIYSLHTFL